MVTGDSQLMEAWKRYVGPALLAVASVLLVLGAVELGMRAARVAPLPSTAALGFRPDNPLLRILRPHHCHDFGEPQGSYFVEVCTNGLGLRDRDHADGENPKILGLGDSFTFGWGVEQNDTFLSHLERALRLGMPHVRPGVQNGGLSYTSQAHQDVLLRYLYQKQSFDAVILAFAEDNDIDENIVWNPNIGVFPEQGEIQKTAVDAYRDSVRGVVAKDFLFRHSALVRFFRQRKLRTSMAAEVAALDERLKAHGLAGAPLSRMAADEARRRFLQAFSDRFDDDWRVTEILLERIRRFVADRGGKLVLLRIPSRMSVEEPAWAGARARFCGPDEVTQAKICGVLDRTHTARRLSEYAAQHRLLYVDPVEDLRRATERGESMYLPEDIHLSRLGHLRVGESLSASVVPYLGGEAPGKAPVEKDEKRRQVGAYWYPWYRSQDWASFTDYTPKGGAYLSTGQSVIERQIHTAERGELDFLMIELLADHNPESKFNNLAVDTMVSSLLERRRRGYSRLKFALMSDIFVGEADIATPERWLEVTRRHLDQIWTRFVEPHRDAYAHVDGKPLLAIFSPAVPVDDPRYTIVRPYWVSHEQWQDWSRKNELLPFWDTVPQTVTDPRFMSVIPGYNDWRLERHPQVGPYLPRLGGRTFVDQWKKVFEIDPEVVLVYSFNEYFEQTQIEPTVEQGDRYLLLNQILSRHYRDRSPPSQREWEHLVDVIEPPPRSSEEKVAWLAIDDPRLVLSGFSSPAKGSRGRALAEKAEISLDVDSEQAFLIGLPHAPSFDRCAGLSITVKGGDRSGSGVFDTELTQLSVLRDVPFAKSVKHIDIALTRVPGADGCTSGGTKPIVITGVTRYPLPTAERLNLGVEDKNVLLEGFWSIEAPPSGAFAWSSDRSRIRVSGLSAGSSYRVTLTFRDAAGFGDLELGPDREHLEKCLITPGKTATSTATFVVTPDGMLDISMKAPTWRPHDKFGSEDMRTLGLALRLITLDRLDAAMPHERP